MQRCDTCQLYPDDEAAAVALAVWLSAAGFAPGGTVGPRHGLQHDLGVLDVRGYLVDLGAVEAELLLAV